MTQEERLADAKLNLSIQRKFCWNAVQVNMKSFLEKLSHDERMKLQMTITNAPCVSECQNFKIEPDNG